MFWRKKEHSPSPPHLTSSIPGIQRHLTAMDSNTLGRPTGKVDGSSLAPGNILVTPDCDHDHGKAQADSSNKPAPDLAQKQAAVVKDDSNISTPPATENTASPNKVGIILSKAQLSRPRLLVLVMCVSSLLFQSLGVGLGLRFINGYTEPRRHQAQVKMQDAWTELHVVHHKLGVLLSTTMEQQYQESYEACLARGLCSANKIFLGINFTPYPNARNQTMDWVMDNCDRLHYTPSVVTSDTSTFLKIMNKLRESAEGVLTLFKHRAALLRSKIRGIGRPLAAEQTVLRSGHNTTTRSRMPERMPLGFKLDCEGRTRCRLLYSGPNRSIVNEKTTLEIAAETRTDLYRRSLLFKKIFDITGHIISMLAILQTLLLACYLGSVRLSCPLPLRQSTSSPETSRTARIRWLLHSAVTSFTHDEKLALGLFINTALYTLLHHNFDFITSEFDRLLLPVGLGFCAFHTPQVMLFFLDLDSHNTETLLSFCRATHELYLIVRGCSVPDLEPEEDSCPLRSAPAASSPTKHTSKIGARFISPLTSISEDLRQERKAMHAEQGKPRDDIEPQYGYATDIDSDYDSDIQHASYVDLTGGATPMVFEDGEEWAVVEE
ncbi:hypothetical protein SVAN01_10753 [Stagonosporopsis vannaccii]|nr:hypothetical protein SVAN01_10753 [Stagonosporopsis vannaccii]